MSIRYRQPDSVRLALTQGDWILVKKHLTAGETRRIFRRMIRQGATGDEIDSLQVGLSKMIVYLLDWSFQDANGNPVVIRDQSDQVKADLLENLPVEEFAEVLKAIEVHEKAMEAEREDEKKTDPGNSKSDPTSPLLDSLVGATNGSPN